MLAAAGRSKARDIADLVVIGLNYSPLILAAAGKPPNFSPRRTTTRGAATPFPFPPKTSARSRVCLRTGSPRSSAMRRRLKDLADQYVMSASPDLPGILGVDKDGTLLEMHDRKTGDAILRRATDEPEVMPLPAEFKAVGWTPARAEIC